MSAEPHNRLDRTFITPIDREDIYRLAADLDDVIDVIDGVARRGGVFLGGAAARGGGEVNGGVAPGGGAVGAGDALRQVENLQPCVGRGAHAVWRVSPVWPLYSRSG